MQTKYNTSQEICPLETPIWHMVLGGVLIETKITGYSYVIYRRSPETDIHESKWVFYDAPQDETGYERGIIFYDCDIPIGHSETMDSSAYGDFYSSIEVAKHFWKRRPREDRRSYRRSTMRLDRKIPLFVKRRYRSIMTTHNDPRGSPCTPEQRDFVNKYVEGLRLHERRIVKL